MAVCYALNTKLLTDPNDLFDAGFARSAEVADDIRSYALWRESLFVAIPSRHPLLAHSSIPLNDLLRYPLVMCDPGTCEGYTRQIDRMLRQAKTEPNVVERSTSLELTLTLVAAGYGVGFVTKKVFEMCRLPDVVVRPLASEQTALTTYLLTKADGNMPGRLQAFIDRALRTRLDPPSEPTE